jgi:hypothetical protein
MWAAYRTLLERRPLATKALTAGAIMGLGDVMQQLVIERTHTPAVRPSQTTRPPALLWRGGVMVPRCG